jgi:hypothetical protein
MARRASEAKPEGTLPIVPHSVTSLVESDLLDAKYKCTIHNVLDVDDFKSKVIQAVRLDKQINYETGTTFSEQHLFVEIFDSDFEEYVGKNA